MRPIINRSHNNKFEWTSSLTNFYNNIRSHSHLTKEEERELIRVIKNGTKKESEAAKATLIKCNLKWAVTSARAYATNQNIEELISEACTGMIEAIDKFDLEKACECDIRFITFASEYIRRRINLYRTNYGSMVRQTNRVKTIHHLAKAKSSFMQKYERQPTSDELLVWLNENYLDEKHQLDDPNDVEELQISSIDEPLDFNHEEDGANSGLMMSYNMATQQSNSVEYKENKEYQDSVIERVLSVIDERDREIIKMCYGIGYPQCISIEDIAEKMKLTKERVRQIKASSIKKMKDVYGNKMFAL